MVNTHDTEIHAYIQKNEISKRVENVDISIDIETLSSRPNAAILQIGACVFDRTVQDHIGETFSVNVSQIDMWPFNGRFHIDADTVAWWMSQEDAARQSVTAKPAYTIFTALSRLCSWFENVGFKPEYKDISRYVWANSPSFDLVILRHALAVTNHKVPWHFRQEMCMRTITMLARNKTGQKIEIKTEGTRHTALDDAIYQARVIQMAYRQLMGIQ